MKSFLDFYTKKVLIPSKSYLVVRMLLSISVKCAPIFRTCFGFIREFHLSVDSKNGNSAAINEKKC